MASSNKWEVVAKGKKNTGESQKMSPKRRSEFIENMPRLTIKDPIELDSTMYSAFLPKEQPQQAAVDNSKDANSKQNGNKKAPSNKKNNKDEKKAKTVDINFALSQLDPKELKSVLDKTQSMFPSHEVIWLKDLASFLNNKLENVKDFDPVYDDKSSGFPLDAVPSAVAKDLRTFMKQFSKETLDSIFFYGIKTMCQGIGRGTPVHGFKVFLQLITQTKSDTGLDHIPQYLELLKTHQNSPSKCLSIMWALGQCGMKHFHFGLKVWLELMLPALEVRQIAHYPVEYLENLFKKYSNLPKKSLGLISLREYFQVLDVFFSPKFTLANDLKARLIAVYPTIKTLAFGEAPSETLRNFFPSYFSRLATAKAKDTREELLVCMTECLITDKQSFGVWCQLYTKHLSSSSRLLSHINSNWPKLSSRFNKKILRETLRSFSVTNEEQEVQTKDNQNDLKLCQTTKDLTMKVNAAHFPWGLLVFILVSVFAGIVTYDMTSSPTFRSSKSMQFLEHYGILALLEKAYHNVHHFSTLSVNWVKVNFPIFYNQVRETVVPFSVTVWNTSREFLINAEVHSRPYRALAMEKLIQFYYWVYELSPEFWIRCEELVWLSLDLTKDYSFRVWTHTQHFAGEAHHWLTEHVLTGSLSKEAIKDTALWGVEHIQNCTTLFVTWTKAFFLATK